MVGSLAGQLLGGTIRCCGAVTELRPSGKAEAVGGLVGISTGEISLSYAAGKLRFIPIILLPGVLGGIGVLLAAGAATALLLSNPPEQPVNAPVPSDPTQLAIPKADLPDPPAPGEGATHSVSFTTVTTATASLATGKVDIMYQSTNPGADHKVIVQLRLSTGVVIAETGAIMPGNMITK